MNIAAIVLAAGQSKRFGEDNKLFTNYNGTPLIDHCLNIVLDCDFSDRILVTGFDQERMLQHIDGLSFRTIHNDKYTEGMGTSLAKGVNELNAEHDAFMVFLADMPDISKDKIQQLITAFVENKSATIVRPTFKGKPGHPVLFAASHKNEMLNLKGDGGAAMIIKKHKTSTVSVEVLSRDVIRDIDLREDLD